MLPSSGPSLSDRIEINTRKAGVFKEDAPMPRADEQALRAAMGRDNPRTKWLRLSSEKLLEKFNDVRAELGITYGPKNEVGVFRRIVMDDLFGGPWEQFVDRPAAKNLTDGQADWLVGRADYILGLSNREFMDEFDKLALQSVEFRT